MAQEISVVVPLETANLEGMLWIPAAATGVVVFAHGSGSSRFSSRNAAVARRLNEAGLATLLFDLLTVAESRDRANVFDIPLLAERVALAVRRLGDQEEVAELPVGLFGASTGAAAALVAAAELPERVVAVVSRGGRADMAADDLGRVIAPTLLIVGSHDEQVLDLNRRALAAMTGPHRLEVVPGAGHLFEEPGAMEQVAELASDWFEANLG